MIKMTKKLEVRKEYGLDRPEYKAMVAMQERFDRLEKMALARGCRLVESDVVSVNDDDTVTVETGRYWLHVGEYPDPVEFDDLDEVEFDLNSREPMKQKSRA